MTLVKDRFLCLLLVLLSTVIAAPGWTQDEGFKNVQQQFEKFSKRSAQEKIFLHTDKSYYLAGEIIWFKLYYVDGALNKPLDFSKVAYVEIVDRSHKPVLQAKVSLTEIAGKIKVIGAVDPVTDTQIHILERSFTIFIFRRQQV